MRTPRRGAAVAVALVALAAVTAQETKLKYPQTKTGDVTDDYHGTKIADPYRWLEDDVRKSKDVADWVEAQNKVTFGFLESIPERELVRAQAQRAPKVMRRAASNAPPAAPTAAPSASP